VDNAWTHESTLAIFGHAVDPIAVTIEEVDLQVVSILVVTINEVDCLRLMSQTH